MALALILLAFLPQQAEAGRRTLGIYRGWASFRDDPPRRCFAVSEGTSNGGGPAFASIATWPGRGGRAELHLRLSRAHRSRSAVILTIDERPFQLVARGSDAWARDGRDDAAIVSAMRRGVAMRVETRDGEGRRLIDGYPLGGAASAIDAALLACRPR